MMLRIVSWNCADHFHKKAKRLSDLNATLAIVPEVREEHADLLACHANLWDGETGNRGLLLAARQPWKLTKIQRATHRHVVRAQAKLGELELVLIGVWSMPGPERYVGTVASGLDELLDDSCEQNVVVAGDFNASAAFDSQNAARHSFDQISQRLHGRGLQSIWHTKAREAFGQESRPTYYHQWKREQPFHIDFMFVSESLMERLIRFSIGDFESWCPGYSDHAPLIADFDLDVRS
jgi:exodeoxyribonuclease-3